MDENYCLFLESVDEHNREFVNQLNEIFLENGYSCDIKTAKNGYMVSYISKKPKRTIANFVFRKTSMKIRIYATHVSLLSSYLRFAR